jgi:hypothetical protein
MAAAKKIDRLTVDLSTCPNLVVIYLGMRMAACGGTSEKKKFSQQQSIRRRNTPYSSGSVVNRSG